MQTESPEKFRTRLPSLLKSRKVRASQLSRELGFSRSYMSQLMTGARQLNDEMVTKIIAAVEKLSTVRENPPASELPIGVTVAISSLCESATPSQISDAIGQLTAIGDLDVDREFNNDPLAIPLIRLLNHELSKKLK